MIPVPYVEDGNKIGSGVYEGFMHTVSRLLPVEGSLAGILNGQRGGDNEYLIGASLLLRLHDHPGDPGIDREARHHLPLPCEDEFPFTILLPLPDRFQFFEDRKAVPDDLGTGGIDEWKGGNRVHPEGNHPQDYLRQIGAQDFGRRKAETTLIILLRIETHADALLHPSAAPLSLVGAALCDGLYGESLCPRPRVVFGDSRQSRIDDIANAGHGDRCLCNVGGDNDLLLSCVSEYAPLIGRREARK